MSLPPFKQCFPISITLLTCYLVSMSEEPSMSVLVVQYSPRKVSKFSTLHCPMIWLNSNSFILNAVQYLRLRLRAEATTNNFRHYKIF